MAQAGRRRRILCGHQPFRPAHQSAPTVGRQDPPGHDHGAVGHAFRPHPDLVGARQGMDRLSRSLPSALAVGQPGNSAGFTAGGMAAELKLQGIHRSDGAAHVFFLANTGQVAGTAACTFQVAGMTPELWDPVTGSMRGAHRFPVIGKLHPPDTGFRVRSKLVRDVPQKQARNPSRPPGISRQAGGARVAGGPWKVSFDPAWGGPAQAESNSRAWTTGPRVPSPAFAITAAPPFTGPASMPRKWICSSFLDLGTVSPLGERAPQWPGSRRRLVRAVGRGGSGGLAENRPATGWKSRSPMSGPTA